jgi:hypothetical protein
MMVTRSNVSASTRPASNPAMLPPMTTACRPEVDESMDGLLCIAIQLQTAEVYQLTFACSCRILSCI